MPCSHASRDSLFAAKSITILLVVCQCMRCIHRERERNTETHTRAFFSKHSSTNLHTCAYVLHLYMGPAHEGSGAGVGVPRAAETDQPAAASRQNLRLPDSWNQLIQPTGRSARLIQSIFTTNFFFSLEGFSHDLVLIVDHISVPTTGESSHAFS